MSLSHDEPLRAPRTLPAKLAALKEVDDLPGSFPLSPEQTENHDTPSKRPRVATPQRISKAVPTKEEMHPQVYHKTTAEKHEDARWLGFFNQTPKPVEDGASKTSIPRLQMTPSKATGTPKPTSTPTFQFTFQREQSLDLSPAAKKIMEEKREEASRVKEQMKSETQSAEGNSLGLQRRIATPKSQKGRFSDAHKQQFQKMDSIAGHASAFRKASRADSNTVDLSPSPVKSLKRSPSKAELDDRNATPSKIARSMKLTEHKNPHHGENISSAKRTKNDCLNDIAREQSASSRLPQPATPSKTTSRAQSGTGGRLKSTISTTGSTPTLSTNMLLGKSPARADIFSSHAKARPAYLLSQPPIRREVELAEDTMYASHTLQTCSPSRDATARTVRKPTSYTATETPSRSKPSKADLSGSADAAVQSPLRLRERFDMLRATPIKSILRTPQRLYSDDPAKVAAGTHFATPPQFKSQSILLRAPATAPVRKHVEFSSSTKAREASKKASVVSVFTAGSSQSLPVASSLVPITYPNLDNIKSVETTPSPKRRQSAGPQDFTFRADSQIVFATSPSPSKQRPVKQSPAGFTIRAVIDEAQPQSAATASGSKKRKMEFENVQSMENVQPSPTVTLGSKKRKFDFENEMAENDADGLSDKENDHSQINKERPTKRLKASESPATFNSVRRAASAPAEEKKRVTAGVKPKALVGKPAAKSGQKKTGTTISMARLNALAMPKKRA